MLDLNRELCVCNSLTLQDIVKLIKEDDITSVETFTQNSKYDIANKCEACVEEGYENDGFSLAMVVALVKQGRV